MIKILIHNNNDIVFTMASNGSIRAFKVDGGGQLAPVDMSRALEEMEEVEIHGAD